MIYDPNNSMQDTFLLEGGGGRGRGLREIKIIPNFTEHSLPRSQNAE